MPIATPSHTVSVTDAAQAVGVSIHSIRRWCEWHAAYLSPEANPLAGQTRRLTGRDIEVLRHIKSLRDTGFQTVSINETLSGLTFAEIDRREEIEPTALDRPQAAPDALVTVDAINALERRFDALESSVKDAKQGQRDYMQGLAVGFVGALLFVILLLLLASLYGGR